jgi:hypothetical protein
VPDNTDTSRNARHLSMVRKLSDPTAANKWGFRAGFHLNMEPRVALVMLHEEQTYTA